LRFLKLLLHFHCSIRFITEISAEIFGAIL